MNTLTKVPMPKEGVEFLSRSHFTIGNDERFTKGVQHPYTSTTHVDYPPQQQVSGKYIARNQKNLTEIPMRNLVGLSLFTPPWVGVVLVFGLSSERFLAESRS